MMMTREFQRAARGLEIKERFIELISQRGEYLNSAVVFYGGVFDGIRGVEFTTNLGKKIMIGYAKHKGTEWKRAIVEPPHLQYGICGFYGRAGWLIDQLSFVFAPQ